MELQTTKRILKVQDLSKVQNIVLVHLSERNSDADKFKLEIDSLFSGKVYIAQTGLNLDLKRNS